MTPKEEEGVLRNLESLLFVVSRVVLLKSMLSFFIKKIIKKAHESELFTGTHSS